MSSWRRARTSPIMEALIFEDPNDEYSYFGAAVAAGQWLDGWTVLDQAEISGNEPFLTMDENTIDGIRAQSWIGIVYINLDVIQQIFAGL